MVLGGAGVGPTFCLGVGVGITCGFTGAVGIVGNLEWGRRGAGHAPHFCFFIVITLTKLLIQYILSLVHY